MVRLDNKTFIISDLHFFHVNIAKYCNRPYSVEELRNKDYENSEILKMNEDILKEFDKLPEKCDIYNNGDLFFVGEENRKKFFRDHQEDMKAIVQRMKGPTGQRRLILILGNHDNLHNKGESRIQFYYSLGFDKVYDTPVIVEDRFILSHEPVYISPANNFINFYGHTHDIDIPMDYFCYDYTNFAEQKRENPDYVPPKSWPDRVVDLDKYFNLCWDKHHKLLDMNSLIKQY